MANRGWVLCAPLAKLQKFGRGIHIEWMQVNCAWIISILRGWAKLVKHTWAKGAERFSLGVVDEPGSDVHAM